jgi:RNA polymerase sigma-70 factor (ECF subfamily)
MDEHQALAEAFEEHRNRLHAVAYRMLGSVTEADDAVQETWLRLSRSDAEGIDELGAWLTTVVSRVCLNVLRSGRTRGEEPLEARVPELVISRPDGTDPEHEALLADAVNLALLVVLDRLSPPERLAFVLHDVFGVPFDEIAPIVDRTPTATRQLASRARRRIQAGGAEPDPNPARQRAVVDAFFAAAREGDFDALVATLDPDVVLRSDGGPDRPEDSVLIRGAAEVAGRALMFASLSPYVRPALVNGVAGVVVAPGGDPVAALGFTVSGGRIVAIDAVGDRARLAALDLSWVAGR